MQLNILDTEKTTVSIQCTSSDTVGLIKKKIADKKGLTDYFILKIAGMSMRDQNTLSNYFITGEQTLVMAEDNTAEEQGPECFSDFNFNSLQNKQKRQFSKDAPAWRIVCPGLNIQARCKNSSCKAYNKPTWVQKGYGNFNIGYQIFNCECPICKQQTHQGFNLSYYQTKITIKGKRKNEQRKFKIEQTVKQNQLSTFAHSDDEMRQWNYLIVEAKKV